jgi:hypothetical protein
MLISPRARRQVLQCFWSERSSSCASYRDVELILAERGVIVSHEGIRWWYLKFGASFAYNLRWRRPQPGDKWNLDKWYLDDVFIRIQRELHYLWRAVDQDGIVLEETDVCNTAQPHPAARAGKAFIECDRWYPSSKSCSDCGLICDKMTLDVRAWTCAHCGAHHDRDTNAARNIRDEGLRILAAGGVASASRGNGRPKPRRNPRSKAVPVEARSPRL